MIALTALLGLLLCLFNAGGAKLFCLTTGCELYAGYSLFGLSFYHYGAAGFALILILALSLRRRPRVAPLLGLCIALGLGLDLLFIAWQILFWPCSSCLVVALLFGGTAFAFRRRYPEVRRRLLRAVLGLWLILLVPVTIAVARETLLTPWPLLAPQDAAIRVFFSPTCPACATEVGKLLQSPQVGSAAFYPIAKNGEDLRRIAALLDHGVAAPRDLEALFRPGGEPALPPSLGLRWRLARNKMALASHGATTIPLIVARTVVEAPQRSISDLLFPGATPPPPAATGGCGISESQLTPCN